MPINFGIRQTEDGYEVVIAENVLLATAATMQDAKRFVLDGAHELLYEVQRLRLTSTMRQSILGNGFPASG